MKYGIQFLKIKCSQTPRPVTWSDMKDSSINPRTLQCMRCLCSACCSSWLFLKKGRGHSAGFPERELDLRNAGGDRASPSPTRPQIHVRSPRSKSPPCLSSSGTATARSHTKVSYNEPKMTVMRAPPRQRALQQRALTHGGIPLLTRASSPE